MKLCKRLIAIAAGHSRPGLALYGFYPSRAVVAKHVALGEAASGAQDRASRTHGDAGAHEAMTGELVEVMSFVARVTNIMTVEPNTGVGYGGPGSHCAWQSSPLSHLILSVPFTLTATTVVTLTWSLTLTTTQTLIDTLNHCCCRSESLLLSL